MSSLEGDLHKIDTKIQQSSNKTHQLIFVEKIQIKSNFPRQISVPLKLCVKILISLSKNSLFTDHRLISANSNFFRGARFLRGTLVKNEENNDLKRRDHLLSSHSFAFSLFAEKKIKSYSEIIAETKQFLLASF